MLIKIIEVGDFDFSYSGNGKQVTELLPDIIYVLDLPKEQYRYLNKNIYSITGYGENDPEISGNLLGVVHPDDVPAMKASIDTWQNNTSNKEHQFRLKKRDGSYSWMYAREHVLEYDSYGKPAHILGVAQDISSYKEHVAHLQTVADTFASAFTYSGVGMALVSTEGRWLDVNNAVCNLTGYSKPELLNLTFQDITHPDDLAVDLDLVQQMLERKIDTYSLEKRYITKEGKTVWAILTVSLVWEDDEPQFFISQIIDITEQKKLAATLTIRNAELETAKINLTGKIERLEELNHIVAHNLRGPANNIQLLTDSLVAKENNTKDANGLGDDMTNGELVMLLSEASASLVSNLNHLMELTTISLDKHVPFDECNVAEVYADIITQLSGTFYEKAAQIEANFAVGTILCPKHYLESILYNLISNALKYVAEQESPQIKVTTYKDDGKIILSVKDNGIGIDLKKYGSRLFKLKQIFHTGYDSKGVGLFLTKAQIEAIGGTIDVKSEPGNGTEFIISFFSAN